METTPITDGLGAFVPGGAAVAQSGAAEGPLKGVTFAAKDIFDVAGTVTGCGNPDWARTHAAAESNAAAVQTLLDAGADLRGKTITDELAYSLNGQNFHYGTPANPNAPGRIPGGSSCGSASAVAGGIVDTALGSDTGGSVRIPGSYCGIFGFRPTHGRISLQGVMPLAPGYDTVGWFTRDAGLLRRVGEVLLGEQAAAAPAPAGLLLAEDVFALADPGVRSALTAWVEKLEARLGKGKAVVVSEPGGGFEAWMLRFRAIQAREIWATHGAWIEATNPKFGPEIAERFDWVQTISDAEADAARVEREVFTARMEQLLEDGAILCMPTAPGIAPLTSGTAEELRAHRSRVLAMTAIAGLARLPQITLPLGRSEGCPVGLSLIGAQGSDMTLLALAEAFLEDGG